MPREQLKNTRLGFCQPFFFYSYISQRENLYPSEGIKFHEHCTLHFSKTGDSMERKPRARSMALGQRVERPWVLKKLDLLNVDLSAWAWWLTL